VSYYSYIVICVTLIHHHIHTVHIIQMTKLAIRRRKIPNKCADEFTI